MAVISCCHAQSQSDRSMPPRRLIVLIAGNFFVATSFLSVGGLLNEISASLRFRSRRPGC